MPILIEPHSWIVHIFQLMKPKLNLDLFLTVFEVFSKLVPSGRNSVGFVIIVKR